MPVRAYNYHIRNNSITQSDSIDKNKHAMAYIHILNVLYFHYRNTVTDRETLDVLLAKWSFDYMVRMADYDFDRSQYAGLVRKKDIFKTARGFKNKTKALILRVFGVKGFCSLMRLLHKNLR